MAAYHQQSPVDSSALFDLSAVSENADDLVDADLDTTADDDPHPAPEGFSCPDDVDADEWNDWFITLSSAHRSAHRTQIAVSGLRAGLTLQALGNLYGISRERVRQLVKSAGITVRDLRMELRQQADRRRRRLERQIYSTSLAYPELEIGELADLWDTDADTVRKALRHRVAVHETRAVREFKATSNEDLLTGLRAWAAQTQNPTGDDYTEWANAHGLPGKQTPTHRFGGWNHALTAAGLSHLVKGRGGPRPQLTDEVLWASVVQFYSADLPRYSFQAYDEYAAQHGLASAATLRVRFGKWSVIHTVVRRLLRYCADPDGTWELGDRVMAISPTTEPRRIVTKEQAVGSLQRVAAEITGPVTVAGYEAARSKDDVAAARIQARCGSWIDALREAGLSHRMSAKAQTKARRSC